MVVEKGIRMDTAINGALRSVICRVEPGTKTNHYLTISLSQALSLRSKFWVRYWLARNFDGKK